ncbi:regulator of chromosome condensation3 [Zea mays]|uniref:Regulator of chromosome condensation3 n=1 Tax=Zea mays TaxID=4577 RepID=A0A1D6Q1E0_MAIZE|nr:regulator of chromosome condensation3 [Zea mays]
MATPLRATAVLAWGSGEDGQLGMGGNEEKDWPHFVEALGPYAVTAVVAGSRNSLAICDDGRLFTWGWNQRGTLGHPPETKTESSPGPVDALAGFKIVQAAIGGWHCLAVDDKGRAYAWGGNEYGQCGEEPERKEDGTRALRRDIPIPQRCALKLKVRQVAAGGTHSVVLTQEGHVWTWGQPWPPGDIKQISTPVRVQGLEKVDIAAGGWHSTALTIDGEVYAWGRGEHGRLGFGDDKSSHMVPLKVELLAGEDIVQVSCGGTHSVALARDGRMFSYGRGDHGRLGYGRKVTTGHPMELPINLPPLSSSRDGRWQAKYVACGGRHTLAIAEWTEATD